jgi:hypothetical protein
MGWSKKSNMASRYTDDALFTAIDVRAIMYDEQEIPQHKAFKARLAAKIDELRLPNSSTLPKRSLKYTIAAAPALDTVDTSAL